jgi:hypothetical protein
MNEQNGERSGERRLEIVKRSWRWGALVVALTGATVTFTVWGYEVIVRPKQVVEAPALPVVEEETDVALMEEPVVQRPSSPKSLDIVGGSE